MIRSTTRPDSPQVSIASRNGSAPLRRLELPAGLAAVFLPLNFFFMSGDPVPWVNPANAFNEGVSINALIPLLSATLLVANLRATRTASRVAAHQLNKEWMPWAS